MNAAKAKAIAEAVENLIAARLQHYEMLHGGAITSSDSRAEIVNRRNKLAQTILETM